MARAASLARICSDSIAISSISRWLVLVSAPNTPMARSRLLIGVNTKKSVSHLGNPEVHSCGSRIRAYVPDKDRLSGTKYLRWNAIMSINVIRRPFCPLLVLGGKSKGVSDTDQVPGDMVV